MSFPTLLAVLTLLIGVPLNLYVTVKLRRLSVSAPGVKVIRERGITATIVLVAVVTFGLIFLQNDLPVPILTGDVTRVVTRLVFLALAIIPAAYWLWLYRKW